MPGLMKLLAAVPDPRDPKLIWYPSDLLLTQGLMMPLINVPSRRQFDSVCLDDNFRKTIGNRRPRPAGQGDASFLTPPGRAFA